VFEQKPTQSSKPRLHTRVVADEPISIAGLDFHAIKADHGNGTVHGFRFGDCAYLTDHSHIPPASMDKLRHLDVLFLDALRYNPHPTHSTVEESLRTVEQLKPKRAFFTHISHMLSHAAVQAKMPANVQLAYDGLSIPIGRVDRT
jgi:phosphoribosyl 1,2-cyclic phosphate phosphodiesterase